MTGGRGVRVFSPAHLARQVRAGDLVVLLVLAVVLYAGVRLAVGAPAWIRGPEISLAPSALPWYTFLSLLRMTAAYVLSLGFSLAYGYKAARSRRAERFLLPVLDILQSVPILSFLPVAVLALTAFLPERMGVELAAVFLIFTSQAWNMTFSWYQSLVTLPTELREASSIFRFQPWLRFRTVELPFAAIPLIWNSMMSWAGGWFFLMAAEMFTVGTRDFRLPGLGSYLHEAGEQGNLTALAFGLGALVAVIVVMDQLVWRPLLAWADRFKLEMVESAEPPRSWFYDLLRTSRARDILWQKVLAPLDERLIRGPVRGPGSPAPPGRTRPLVWALGVVGGAGLLVGGIFVVRFLAALSGDKWLAILAGAGATSLRVAVALGISLLWTVPVGVAIGLNPRAAGWLQPVVQIAASVPATALFPAIVLGLAHLPGGLNLAAVLLMLAGSQWYILFNVIAGARAIPQDLKYTTSLLGMARGRRWRVLILPALFPYLVTGLITAGGGAWNASIVAEYATFAGQTLTTPGLGSLISQATADGDYPLLLAATLTMIVLVLSTNRLVWRRLYRLAEERYKWE
ncbi:MAG: ABC transporter permease subunit [Candidatus Bipolaricaulota bacterium]|nr:ABC transporter permease subunit [Candidatus Bipolaricaulota bacterium]